MPRTASATPAGAPLVLLSIGFRQAAQAVYGGPRDASAKLLSSQAWTSARMRAL